MARLSWPGWLVSYRDGLLIQDLKLETVGLVHPLPKNKRTKTSRCNSHGVNIVLLLKVLLRTYGVASASKIRLKLLWVRLVILIQKRKKVLSVNQHLYEGIKINEVTYHNEKWRNVFPAKLQPAIGIISSHKLNVFCHLPRSYTVNIISVFYGFTITTLYSSLY